MRGAEAFTKYLEAEGVRYLFGNPGTTEVPIMDALVDSSLEYVLCLQENVAVAAADGLAQSTGRPAVVNLHTGPGLAQGFSALYMAARHRAPLVVTAGNEYSDFAFSEPLLWADLARMAQPLVKWSYEPARADLLVDSLRRAFRVAQTPPQGPVFLSIPLDHQRAELGEVDLSPARVPSPPAPDPAAVEAAARLLAGATNPCIVAGDDVSRTRSVEDLVSLAEKLGAKVFGAPLSLGQPFPNRHPLWGGSIPPFPAFSAGFLAPHDVVLVLGARAMYMYYYQQQPAIPEGAKLIHVHPDPWELHKNFPAEVACVATADRFIAALTEAWSAVSSDDRKRAAARADEVAKQVDAKRQERAGRRPPSGEGPLNAYEAVSAAVEVGGDDLVFVDESVTSSGAARQIPDLGNEVSFFGHKGGALGWGSGAALGVALGLPGRSVVATLGDGSLMYCPQALWTAARYRIPVVYLVLNNAGYAIIKGGTAALGGRAEATGRYIGMDIVDPEINFVSLSEGLGVPAVRVETPEALTAALDKAFSAGGPFLIDAAIDRGFPRLPV